MPNQVIVEWVSILYDPNMKTLPILRHGCAGSGQGGLLLDALRRFGKQLKVSRHVPVKVSMSACPVQSALHSRVDALSKALLRCGWRKWVYASGDHRGWPRGIAEETNTYPLLSTWRNFLPEAARGSDHNAGYTNARLLADRQGFGIETSPEPGSLIDDPRRDIVPR